MTEIFSSGEELDQMIVRVLAEDSVEYESQFLGQHGISILLEPESRGKKRAVLVDVGQNPDALLFNMEKMNIPVPTIDMVVLTHCHYDHTRGLATLVRAVGKKGLPIIGHPDIFRPNFVTCPFLRHVGMTDGDSMEKVEEAGGRWYLSKDPFPLMDGLITTGEVPRNTDFESTGISLFTLKNGLLKEDPMPDDISVIARVKGKGLVIITGCSHAGIVNIVQHAMKLTGTESIHAIIGGLHLIEVPAERIARTVEALSELHIDLIAVGHCTGFPAQAALFDTFRERLIPLRTGMLLEV